MRSLARSTSDVRAAHLAAIFAVVVAVAVGGALVGCGGSEAREPRDPPRLSLVLSLPQGPLAPGEAVPLSISLENVGTAPALVNTRLLVNEEISLHDVWLKLIGPKGRQAFLRVRVDPDPEEWSASREWRVLAPGEKAGVSYDLAKYYDLTEAGFYAVQAVYENAQDAPKGLSELPAWKGRLGSNVLRFQRGKGR